MKRNEKSKVPITRMLGFLNNEREGASVQDSDSSGFYDGDYKEKKDDTMSIRGSTKHKEVSSLIRKNRHGGGSSSMGGDGEDS
jgi:hypothetical protein